MRLIRWQRVRSSVDGLPFVPVVVTQAGRRKLAGAKEPSQRIRRIRELTMGVVVSQSTIKEQPNRTSEELFLNSCLVFVPTF